MKSGNYPLSRAENIVVQELADELLIYDLTENKALCLNKTSKLIWQECDGTKSVADISRTLSNKFRSSIGEDFVWLALQQFKKDNLLEKSDNFVTPLDGLNRREVIKRIGFASMVALPLVSSILAPTAVLAQSAGFCGCTGAPNTNSRAPGCPCTANSQCCNNVCGGGGTVCSVSTGVVVGPACCPAGGCPPANGTNIPPGCGCNGNANCASNTCINSICAV